MYTKKDLIGVDLGQTHINLVSLSKKGKSILVDKVDSEILYIPGKEASEDKSQDIWSSTLRNMIIRSKVKSKNASTSIMSSKSIVKVIHIPNSLSDDAIEEFLKYEGSNHIPLSMDAVNFDFVKLPEDGKDKDRQSILLVACKKEEVEEFSAVLETAGLKAAHISIDQLALWNLHEHIQGESAFHMNTAIVKVGFHSSNLFVFEKGRPAYVKDHNFGLFKLVQGIQDRYQLKFEDAYRMLIYGGLPSDFSSTLLVQVQDSLAQDVFRSIDFFQAAMPDISIENIEIYGNINPIIGIENILERNIGIPVSCPDPFTGMELNTDMTHHTQKNRYSFAVSCGLSLQKVY